jgi:hypothetical protein
MKTYVLMGKFGGKYESDDRIMGISRDRSKAELMMLQLETKEVYKKVQWEIYEKAEDAFNPLEREFYDKNPQPKYLHGIKNLKAKTKYNRQWKSHMAKYDKFYAVVWDKCLNEVLAKYGVRRNFMPKYDRPDDIVTYYIKEYEEL